METLLYLAILLIYARLFQRRLVDVLTTDLLHQSCLFRISFACEIHLVVVMMYPPLSGPALYHARPPLRKEQVQYNLG